ncbi:thioredoxin-disulfide reductase [Candidatus Uhrbacteria bacterium]|nr:thioredoxin-disulfide reductase [Candidatus Uhrbacteria bacterium]
MENVIIIGSGPAGYTAAIYAARANLAPLLFEGAEPGGQLTTTSDVENYPGYAEGVLGPKMMEDFKKQAERFGTKILSKEVTRVDFGARPFKVWAGEELHEAKAIIISTGASAKRLGLENEKKLYGKGVSACATCDGFFFKEKIVVVVGGGDTAMEEATFLTKFASKVYVVHRRNEFRASKIMLERAQKNPKIEFILNSAVEDVLGAEKGRVTGVKLNNLITQSLNDLPCDGLFVAIGHEPNTKIFTGQIELDQKGYVVTRPGETMTSVEGVFAGGDCVDHKYRQAVTAAGMGCAAAMDTEKWLEAQE